MSRKMTGIVKTFDRKSGKGFIIPPTVVKKSSPYFRIHSPRRRSAYTRLRVEFCRVNGLRGPTAANVYLS
ncbi:cold-shock protein [Escherichia coli]|nr:cold-shock protein [Escherichia coli]